MQLKVFEVVNDYGCPLPADPFLEGDVETEHWERAFEAMFEEVVEADERDVETIQEETAEEIQGETSQTSQTGG